MNNCSCPDCNPTAYWNNYNALVAERDQFSFQNYSLLGTINALEVRADRLEQTVHQQAASLVESQTQLQVQWQESVKEKEIRQVAERNLEELRGQLPQRDGSITKLKGQVQELEKAYAKAKEREEGAERHVGELEMQLAQAGTSLAECKDQVQGLKQANANLNEQQQKGLEKLKEQLATVRSEKTVLQAEVARLKKQQKLDAAVQETAQKTIQKLNQDLAQGTKELEASRSKAVRQERAGIQKIKELSERLDQMVADMAVLRPPTVSVASGEPLIDIEARLQLPPQERDIPVLKKYWAEMVTILFDEAAEGRFEKSWIPSMLKCIQYANEYADRADPYIMQMMTKFFTQQPLAAPATLEDLKNIFIHHPYLAYALWKTHPPTVVYQQFIRGEFDEIIYFLIGSICGGREDAAKGYDLNTLFEKSLLMSNSAGLEFLSAALRTWPYRLDKIDALILHLSKDPQYHAGIARWKACVRQVLPTKK